MEKAAKTQIISAYIFCKHNMKKDQTLISHLKGIQDCNNGKRIKQCGKQSLPLYLLFSKFYHFDIITWYTSHILKCEHMYGDCMSF